jgi:serine/threonine protein kinase/tetratricopeptide (TPR) repeat protein
MTREPIDEKEVFNSARRLAVQEERVAYLQQVCGHEPRTLHRILELLNVHFQDSSFLESPAVASGATIDTPAEEPGTLIGPYKLLEQIGEGGMGLVFMAEQSRPVRRRVALKVIKPGMDTRHVVVRFEAERQALALMDHPNIAHVFDAGTTASGRPYFVMELVRGVPITEFCDQRRFTTRQRLELFVTVCQAVQHAHQKGIIHRDLKPSNVLVTLHDVVAVPKIIDFGIAKATTQRLTEQTLFTNFAQIIGTPLYMSPEQADMNGLDVDTRSDVYALGVLLYELLTGTTPFESQTLKKVGLDEMRRMIREEEPPTPSQRLSTLNAQVCETVSERRGVDSRRLGQVLRGELDWIVMKALEKDRDRRYESASVFAADVQRYLNDEAVAACPPSAGYRLRKYVRRNRRVLAMVGVVVATLITATAVSIWQAARATEAQHQAEADRKQAEADRDRAKTAEGKAESNLERARQAEKRATTEAAISRAVNAFLQEDLLGQVASAPPGRAFGEYRPFTVKEALDRAAARIGNRFQDQPLVEAAIRMAMGIGYAKVYEFTSAVPHLERAIELRKTHLGPDHEDTLDSMSHLAETYMWLARHSESIALRQQVLETSREVLGPNHLRTRLSGSRLALSYQFAGQLETSSRLYEQLLDQHRTLEGPTHPATLGTMHQLAWNYGMMGRLRESLAMFEKLFALRNTGFGRDLDFLHYVIVCQWAGKYDQVDKLLHEAAKLRGPDPGSINELYDSASLRGFLALNLLLQKRYEEAEPIAREVVAMNQTGGGVNQFPYWVSVLGAVLLGQRKYTEAEPILLKGYEGMKQFEVNFWAKRRAAEVCGWIVRLYDESNQPEKARMWRAKLEADSQAAGKPKEVLAPPKRVPSPRERP